MTVRSLTLFHDGHVLTAPGRFERVSLVVADGRLVEIIPRGGEGAFAGRDGVTMVDLDGRYAVPGFVDAHFHLRALAAKRLRCDLSRATSGAEAAALLGTFARRHPGEGPVVGVEWDESGWDDPSPPTRAMLDDAAPRRPVLARRVCGHVGVVNTAFLEQLDDAPQSRAVRLSRFIERNSGRVIEDALWAANAHAAPDRASLAGAFGGAVGELHALGVTAIGDIVTPDDIETYLEGISSAPAAARLRIDAYVVGTTRDLAAVCAKAAGLPVERFRAVGVKCFADGSLGGHTAALRERYADADTRGELLMDEDALAAAFADAEGAAVTCAVHAIGDRAVEAVLAAAERVRGAAVRIEHAEVLDEALVDRAAARGVAMCVQPNFIRNWGGEGGLYARRLGPARWALANPLRLLESRAVPFLFGSDGMPPGPLFGLAGAVRHPVGGMSLSPASALARSTGTLARDTVADLAVLSGNPLLSDPDRLRVEQTWVGGECVFEDRPGHRRKPLR